MPWRQEPLLVILCDLEIWQMTLQNNWAHRLCYFKLCASSQNHLWIQTGFTVQKHSICMKKWFFLSSVTLKFEGWPWIWHLFYTTSSFVHNFVAICEFKNEVSVRKSQNLGRICFELFDLDLSPLTLTFCMDIPFVNDNYSWKFHDDMMRGTFWKRCDRQTDLQTYWQMERQNHS